MPFPYKSQPIVVGRGGGTVTLFNEFFHGEFIFCLKVNIAVSLKNLKLQAIEVGGGGIAENPSHPLWSEYMQMNCINSALIAGTYL